MDTVEMNGRAAHDRKMIARAACLVASLLWMGCSGILLAEEHLDGLAYSSLQPPQVQIQDEEEKAATMQAANRWDTLRNINDACMGWLSVAGTPISYPVVQGSKDRPDYYLTHNFYRQRDGGGCLYIDARTTLNRRHIMVFGHHIVGSDTMFGALSHMWEQGRFSQLSTATLSMPDGSTRTYDAFCSFKVKASDALIQSFEWSDDVEFVKWLAKQRARSTAQGKQTAIKNPEQVLTLVTCSGNIPGKSERTVVLFIRKQ